MNASEGSETSRTLKLLKIKLVQAEDPKSGSNIPYDMNEGIDAAKVNDEVVVHRVDCEC